MNTDPGREHLCRGSDGTVLSGLMWECANPRGLVVIRTPYDAGQHAATARSWNARGYHCLVQDVRGRYRSAGAWSPFTYEEEDGAQLLSRLVEEHEGLPLVLFGASYAAHTALEAARAVAREGTCHVSAIIVLVPALGLAETAWDTGGSPQVLHRIGWWHEHGRHQRSQPPLPAAELDRRVAQAHERGVVEAAEDWNWSPSALAGWRRLWSARRLEPASRYGRVDVPLLVISGDDDFFHEDALRLARGWKSSTHLASGPWGHRLASGVTDRALRADISAAGGLPHIIDPWLAAQGLPGSPAEWTGILASAPVPRTRSTFDPAIRAWHHSRTNG